jgi:hypothetical protein
MPVGVSVQISEDMRQDLPIIFCRYGILSSSRIIATFPWIGTSSYELSREWPSGKAEKTHHDRKE